MNGPDFSIIIPVFNESAKISRDVAEASRFFSQNHLKGEIIVVDDGSADATAKVAGQIPLPPHVQRNIIRYANNQGKGYAIRQGMLASKGRNIMFADSGYCIPFENALKGLAYIESGQCEIAHCSRRLAESVIIRPHLKRRQISARLFSLFVTAFMKIPGELTDTQCGFKVYRGDIGRALYGECKTKGFMFDIEIILRALKKGYRIKEFPVKWTADPDSRLELTKVPLRILYDLYRIKKNIG